MTEKNEYVEHPSADIKVPSGYGKYKPNKVANQVPDENSNNGEDQDETEASAKDPK